MASLGELYPDCVEAWVDSDGESIPAVRYECVWEEITKDGDRVISTKAELRSLGDVRNYNEQDSGHVLVRIKGKGWYALAADASPGLKALARWMV